MLLKVMMVTFVGGVLCLDRVLIQALVSRPIVVAPIVGLILNDPYTGLIVGAFVELFWIDRLPIGTYVPPNDSIVALLITSASILAGQKIGYFSRELVALSFLIFIPFGILAQKIDTMVILSNDALSRSALLDAERSDVGGITRKHLWGLMKSFLSTTVFIFVSLYFGVIILVHIFPHLPKFMVKVLTMVYFLLPILGIAVAINTIKQRHAMLVFYAVSLAVLIFLEWIYGLR
jgi:mannose/fructose/N-acetylgalactosamine-specific phosphotransferase system component IIC